MVTRPSIPNESYYRDGRTSETERLPIITTALLPTRPAPIVAGVLIGLGIFLLGWHMRELFALPVDYHLLVLVVPLTAGAVAWGNSRRDTQ
jgi:hypothetical protein